ncbi:MAG: dTDP-glucose 4,6-dehydratase [Halanaerobiales bacterium]|nr:dTDP-glucose 4,6-dehydratase [Halanaerobiales bacterium]
MKIYLVTGGAGFIGSNFIKYLMNKYSNSIKIINFDKLTYAGNQNNLKEFKNRSNYHFIKGDICDKTMLESVFENYDIDYIVNFAAESHVDRSIKDSELFIKTNVLGVQVILTIAKKYWTSKNGFKKGKNFLQISTDEVYGSLNHEGFFTELTPLNPHNPYSASKASADLLVKAYFDTYQFPINITRCSNNYGPYQFPEKLIPLMISNCLDGKSLPIYGDGKNIRDWLYVEDHCKAIDLVLHNGQIGEVYNIGGHNEKQNIEIVKIIIRTLQKFLPEKSYINEDLIQFVEDRKGHDRRYAIDPTKISKELNWEPNITFEEGMKKTIEWYLKKYRRAL